MGKNSESRIKPNKDGDTKVLFKKSNLAMFPHSRTISGASQLYSRSGILQIKKNLATNQHAYYTDRGKVKRDLSVETDICILRRYYRNKKNSLLGITSGKSKHSTLVDTECETIEEYPDTSGCGDNDTDKSNQPLDIASLMIDNLKDLLKQWIQKHLVQNKDTKQKIDTVLDSLIQKLDTRNNLPSSSGSTYILHKEAGKQEVKNKKVATASLTCPFCKHESRYANVGSSAAGSGVSRKRVKHTAPFHYKDLRIISTLSIPRSFHKRGLNEKKEQNSSWYRMKKIKHKNIVLSIDRSNKLIDSSSFDLVAISTKSFTKKSKNNETIAKKKKRHILFYPKPFYKSTTETSSVTNHGNLQINNIDIGKDQLEAMPSLLKSLYANEPNMPEKNIQYDAKNSNYTMAEINSNKATTSNAEVSTEIAKDIYFKQKETEKYLLEENESQPTVAKDFIDRIINFSNFEISNLTVPKNKPIKIKNSHKKNSNRGKVNNFKKRVAYKSIQHKQFIQKANSQTSQRTEFLKHCQNVLQYFKEHKNNNIKLDVQINVNPKSECKTKDVSTDVNNQTLGIYDIKFNPTLLYNIQSTKVDASVHMDEEPIKYKTENKNCSSDFFPEIIPLLDSSVCQAKFIFNVNSKEKETFSNHNGLTEQSTLTSELEIVQEISELRAVIRGLASAAERLVNEQLKKESNKSIAETNISHNPSNYISSSKVKAVINLKNPSKAKQFSKELIEKQKLLSGLKVTKEPKREETFDFYNRLAKKSTSYRIIDSESILRVTDMTSRANELNELPNIEDNPDIRSSRVTRVTNDAVCRSLQKSKSLFEITSEQTKKRKVPAVFRDQKNPQCRVCSIHRNLSPSSCSEKSCRKLKKLFTRAKKKANSNQEGLKLPHTTFMCGSGTNYTSIQSLPALDPHPEPISTPRLNYSSTVACPPDDAEQKLCIRDLGEDEEAAHFCSSLTQSYVSAEDDPIELRLQKCYKERKGMGFGEGCVYCMLLWIPILLLGCLFYAYVLKDSIKVSLQAVEPDVKSVTRQNLEMKPVVPRNETSFLHLKPSDLGF